MSNWKNNFNTTTFEDFMKKFFGDSLSEDYESSFFNKKIIVPLGNDKMAEVVLSIKNTHGEYKGFKVTIIHKVNGKISSEWFGFDEYLGGRSDINSHHRYSVIDHCGKDWYMDGPEPKQIKKMAKRIAEYINLYI